MTDLRAYGYAPGKYAKICTSCLITAYHLDKGAIRCEICAQILKERHERQIKDFDEKFKQSINDRHADDAAIAVFAGLMRDKLKWERDHKNRSGWDDPNQVSEETLIRLFVEHLPKGNDGNWVDLANLAMMLHIRGIHPSKLTAALRKPE